MLNSSTLAQYRYELQIIGEALKDEGDILLYGCDVASGLNGKSFIERLAAYTQADVAASTDVTGAPALGGNWLLEASAGAIEAQSLAPQNFTGKLAATLPPGALDPSFGVGGRVLTSLGGVADLVFQPDGKIVTGIFGTDFVLARYNPDGSLDASFGVGGIVSTAIGPQIGPVSDSISSVVLQADGKIVAGGYSTVGGNLDFALVRYNTDGSLDTSFDGDGISIVSFGAERDYISSVVVQADGKIVAGGTGRWPEGNSNFALARYNPDGSLDPSFDGDGMLLVNMSQSDWRYTQYAEDGVNTLFLQADGKILGVGYSDWQYGVGLDTQKTTLARFNTDGSLDTGFDGDGKVTIERRTIDALMQPDGKVVMLTNATFGPPVLDDFRLVRYNADGSRDTTFSNEPLKNFVGILAVQPDGKIVAAGSVPDNLGGSDAVLWRYTADGYLDTAFADNGVLVIAQGTYSVSSLSVQNDGLIVIAGFAIKNGIREDFSMLRVSSTSGIEDFSVQQGGSVHYTIAPQWQPDAPLYSATMLNGSALPSWLSFDDSSLTFSGTPGSYDQGRYEILVTTTNSAGAIYHDEFTLAVTTIAATSGNDTLYGGLRADTMTGLAGDDVYWVDSYLDGVIEAAGEGTDLVVANLNYTLPTNVENLNLIGTDYLQGAGNGLDNVMEGNAGNNKLSGLDGNDTLIGGAGKDSLDGGLGDDRLMGGAGIDTLNGGVGVDYFDGGADNDRFIARLDGETLVGGEGVDTVDYSAIIETMVVELWNQRAFAAHLPGVDTLIGIENVIGSSVNDSLSGDGGNNLFKGGKGFDGLFGGDGIDTADYSDGGAVFVELWSSQARNDGQGAADYLNGIENLIGSSFDDTLIGDGYDNTFKAGAGFDQIYGGSGTDTVDYSGATSGVYVELWRSQARNDGQGATDYLNNVENLIGSAFNDVLIGDGSDNVFKGGAGFDQFYGGSGVDTVDYRDAIAAVTVNLTTDGAGNDGQGAYDYTNSIENLIGSAFGDSLIGDANGNTISGAGGSDFMMGAGGADGFVFNSGDGRDVITDFSLAHGDKLFLQSNLNGSGITTGAQALAHTFDAGGNAIIDLGGGNSFALLGVSAASLTPGDFVIF